MKMRRISVTEPSLGPPPHIKPGHVGPGHTPTCRTNMVMSSSPGPESSQKAPRRTDLDNTWCFILFKARPSSPQENGGGGGGGGGGEPDPEGHHQDFGRAQISDGSLKLQHIKKRWNWTEARDKRICRTQRYNHSSLTSLLNEGLWEIFSFDNSLCTLGCQAA